MQLEKTPTNLPGIEPGIDSTAGEIKPDPIADLSINYNDRVRFNDVHQISPDLEAVWNM
jgi:hypothetical protein